MNTVPEPLKAPLADLLLALADDKLILGHRNSDWTGLGPILEEDIAFSHLAQDEMAHAQVMYELAGSLIGQSADEIAFGRPPHEYRCAHIVEIPDEFNWATALARKFFCDHFDRLRLRVLCESSYKPLADLSRRIAAEEDLHVQHVDQWMQRLGRGTADSHDRLQRALDALLPHAVMLFEPTEGERELSRAKILPRSFADDFDAWRQELSDVARRSNLLLAFHPPYPQNRGGRRGAHTPYLKELLDEMCEVWRVEPGANW